MNMARMEMAPDWLIAGLVWPAIAAQLLCLGSAALVLILLRHSARHADFASHSVRVPNLAGAIVWALVPWWRVFAAANLFFFALFILAKTAGMAGVTWPQALPLVSEVMTGTHAGAVWLWQAPTALALLLVSLVPLPARLRAATILFLATALLLMDSLTSHAIDYGLVAIAFDFVHEIATGLWAGALLSCWIVARHHAYDEMIVAHAARILSRLAAWSILFIMASGLYIAWRAIGFGRHELLYSSYSHVLAIKLAVFAGVLSIGAWNRFRLMPHLLDASARHQLLHNVGVESIIILAVIGLAALLANTSPARMQMRATAADRHGLSKAGLVKAENPLILFP
jgi:putative copper export protein